MTSKPTLRKIMRTRLDAASSQTISTSSQMICKHIISQKFSPPSPVIAVFSAHGPEVDLSDLHQLFSNSRLVYPLCHAGGILTFHHVSDTSTLSPGTLGILEPSPQHHPEIPILNIGLFLCPGLAFGRDGSRLGHGGGFYDRALVQRSPTALTIGVALNLQVFDSVPSDQHDIPLDHLITETGIVY